MVILSYSHSINTPWNLVYVRTISPSSCSHVHHTQQHLWWCQVCQWWFFSKNQHTCKNMYVQFLIHPIPIHHTNEWWLTGIFTESAHLWALVRTISPSSCPRLSHKWIPKWWVSGISQNQHTCENMYVPFLLHPAPVYHTHHIINGDRRLRYICGYHNFSHTFPWATEN